jgi:hypothetical protein
MLLKQTKKEPKLKDVHKVFKKWLHIEDTDFIDLLLSVALTKNMKGTPIWMLVVGASGDGKTECVMSLNGYETKILHQITPNTLVSGFTVRDKETGERVNVDLAPKLDDKLLIIPDMAQLLQLHPNQKAQVWAQLRDLFDGFAGKQAGTGLDTQYTGLRVTLIACSTPSIDSQILIHQDLGTRELVWRTKKTKKTVELMNKVWFNEGYEIQMRSELNQTVLNFLNNKKIEKVGVDKKTQGELMKYAILLSYMRAPAHFDKYRHELLSDIYPEKPTRVLKQFKRLFIALKSLDSKYSDERALGIINKIALSSGDPNRVKVFNYLIDRGDDEHSISSISRVLKIGKATVKRNLWALANMGIANVFGDDLSYSSFKINLEHKLFNIDTTEGVSNNYNTNTKNTKIYKGSVKVRRLKKSKKKEVK